MPALRSQQWWDFEKSLKKCARKWHIYTEPYFQKSFFITLHCFLNGDSTFFRHIHSPHQLTKLCLLQHNLAISTHTFACNFGWFFISDPQPDMAWNLFQAAICVQNVGVHVSCSSHVCTQLAAFFIDPRAEWSTTRGWYFSSEFIYIFLYKSLVFFGLYICFLYKNLVCWSINWTAVLLVPFCLLFHVHTQRAGHAEDFSKFRPAILTLFQHKTCFFVFIISVMILPQVHLRKPCYDFYFL